ncbi:hypothetical protein D9M68_721010 [compost metagenome]
MAGDHDHGQVRVDVTRLADHRQAVGPGQAHVGHDHAGQAGADVRQHGLRRIEGAHGDVGQLQRLHTAQLHGGVVFHQENGEGAVHGVGDTFGCMVGCQSGTVSVKQAPAPGALRAVRPPLNSAAISRQITRPSPRPAPLALVV